MEKEHHPEKLEKKLLSLKENLELEKGQGSKLKELNIVLSEEKEELKSELALLRNENFKESGIKILINEYNQCNERIESFLNRQDSIMQISLALIGGTIAFTLLNPIPEEFYLIIPILPIILFLHISYHYTRVIANQGYRTYLESRLNLLLPENSQVNYSAIAKKFLLNKNPVAKINSIVFPSLLIVSIFFSVIMSNFNLIVVWGNILIAILVGIVTFNLIRFTINLNEKVEKFC